MSSLPYHIAYKHVVLAVLQRRQGVHFHIGHLNDEQLREIFRLLEEHGIAQDQFCYLGPTVGLAHVLTQLDVDVYLPTLPQSGGKALVDAMAAGVPVILHQNARDRQWSSIDLVYPEAPSWTDLAELDRVLNQFDQQFWETQCAASRAYFDRYHAGALFEQQLAQGGATGDSADIPPLKRHAPEIGAALRLAGFRQ